MYKMELNNIYYVYEWYNIDTNEIFYVGKGKNDRYKHIKGRNKFFTDYYNTHRCSVRKMYENLTEKEAFQKEIELIKYYKENTGYRLTNQTEGGEGSSGLIVTQEFRNKMRNIVMGKNNPNYGNKWTDEMKEIARNKMLNRYDGKNNPNYGNKWSREQIKQKHNKAKSVICDGVEFVSLSECARYYNVPYTSMQCWINKKYKMPKEFEEKGLRWIEE